MLYKQFIEKYFSSIEGDANTCLNKINNDFTLPFESFTVFVGLTEMKKYCGIEAD